MSEEHRQRAQRPSQPSQAPSDRVSVLGDFKIPPAAINALSKGPKFIITENLKRDDLQHIVQLETAALAYALRWNATMAGPTTSKADASLFSLLRRACPFHTDRKEPPRDNPDVEKQIQGLQMDLQRLVERSKTLSVTQNISSEERKAIASLRANEDITITRSDKGGELVIMKTSQLEELCLAHLNDTSTYQRLKKDPTNSIRMSVNKSLERILTRCEFPVNITKQLMTPTTARVQRFYALPKTHKTTLKIRPIVSACGGVFDRLGWLLQHMLKPLLRHVEAHVSNTSELISRFNSTEQEDLKGMIPISFDVVSLYTNINVEEAIVTTLEYINKYNLYTFGLLTAELFELLHLLLDNNVFKYENHGLFKQVRGLAMGNRLSGTLAIIVMDRFERKYIYRELKPTPVVYVRYVDDVGTTIHKSQDPLNMLSYLNKRHPTIKFELELPDDNNFLPILDIKMKINVDGTWQRKLFSKAASKGITLHFNSHHPSSIKKAVVRNEMQRTALCSSEEHHAEAIAKTTAKLKINGYPSQWIDSASNRRRKPAKQPSQSALFSLRLPFITDAFNRAVSIILRKHNIPARLVNHHGQSLRDFSKRKQKSDAKPCQSSSCPAPRICGTSSVVYKATCKLCGLAYIGMTGRKLHDRMREHMYAARNHDPSSAFGEHYGASHPGDTVSLDFEILARQRDNLRLHIEEAIKIKELKPALNRRREDLGTGFLPT